MGVAPREGNLIILVGFIYESGYSQYQYGEQATRTVLKSTLQEQFLNIANDIRREVAKTKFIRGTPSLESQMGTVSLFIIGYKALYRMI